MSGPLSNWDTTEWRLGDFKRLKRHLDWCYTLPRPEHGAMTDDLNTKRKRLYFRSIRRGTKESDLVIGGFAEANLSQMGARQLDQFEALLERNDPEVLAWIVGLTDPPTEFDNEVLDALRQFKKHMPHDRV